ncbi:Stimulated by retinoic acid gene 6 protein-like [Merluccius polli]|uniref:Stimulated by retinoic acid gene 6 protein-like n=1 Tax=Merluccius polli TaxID=89951 RepID=A0AA47MFX1_MERPO|nr:Stimulated by retinoic acid gene 6 protein-like [Merluccius polli]
MSPVCLAVSACPGVYLPRCLPAYVSTYLGVYLPRLNLAVFLAVGFLQVMSVQMFFLQDKLTSTEKHKPLAVNNRRAFSCFSYFFFFYNVVLGLTTCVQRLFCSLGIGTVLLARIDRTIMPKGYETRDLGGGTTATLCCFTLYAIRHTRYVNTPACHLSSSTCPSSASRVSDLKRALWPLRKSDGLVVQEGFHIQAPKFFTWWVGMILADHYHANPTLVCFCDLLMSRAPGPQTAYRPFHNTSHESGVNCRARKRWALAYTLLRNPHLIPMRKHLLVPPPAPSASQPSDPDATIPTVVMAARI